MCFFCSEVRATVVNTQPGCNSRFTRSTLTRQGYPTWATRTLEVPSQSGISIINLYYVYIFVFVCSETYAALHTGVLFNQPCCGVLDNAEMSFLVSVQTR
jgi:hypothetical protein